MKLVSIKKLVNSFSEDKSNFNSNKFDYRKKSLVSNIDFLIDSFLMCKFDIIYMQKLNIPLSDQDKIYFEQQIDRLNHSIKILSWMRNNIMDNSKPKFWRKFLKWKIY